MFGTSKRIEALERRITTLERDCDILVRDKDSLCVYGFVKTRDVVKALLIRFGLTIRREYAIPERIVLDDIKKEE